MTKRTVVDVWSATSSGSLAAEGAPGSERYAQSLLAESSRYAPWLPEVLGISSAGRLSVLDVGCGPGLELVRFALAGAHVTGIDLVPAHVEQARAHLGGRRTVEVGDAESLSFVDNVFDRVVSVSALQFTPHPQQAFREIRRVLRPGGDLRLVVHHRFSYVFWEAGVKTGVRRGQLRKARTLSGLISRTLPWSMPDMQIHTFTRRDLRHALRQAGLEPMSVQVRSYTGDPLAPLHNVTGLYLSARATSS